MKITIDIPEKWLHVVTIPDNKKDYKIVNYGYGGTWLVDADGKELNAWKTKLPDGKYEILGNAQHVMDCVVENDKLLVLRKLKY